MFEIDSSKTRCRWWPLSRRYCRVTAVLGLAGALSGCDEGVWAPAGPVGFAEWQILIDALAIMLAIAIPTILGTLGVAWWFRASNRHARYLPDFQYSGRVELVTWSIPAMVVLLLGGIAWQGSHDLDPPKPLPSVVRPIRVEVVSLDWKWLFIYPEQGIASVNHLVVPAGVPVTFKLTSASVMNSFFVPQLGSQIYTMHGMVTRLNLQADRPGAYQGLSAQFSGDGFSDMRFKVDALPAGGFDQWVAGAKGKGPALDIAAYRRLTAPSAKTAPFTYGVVSPGLFDSVAAHDPSSADPAMAMSSALRRMGQSAPMCGLANAAVLPSSRKKV